MGREVEKERELVTKIGGTATSTYLILSVSRTGPAVFFRSGVAPAEPSVSPSHSFSCVNWLAGGLGQRPLHTKKVKWQRESEVARRQKGTCDLVPPLTRAQFPASAPLLVDQTCGTGPCFSSERVIQMTAAGVQGVSDKGRQSFSSQSVKISHCPILLTVNHLDNSKVDPEDRHVATCP